MASVLLNEVDDFISPSQACVNPLYNQPESDAKDSQKSSETSTVGKNGDMQSNENNSVRRRISSNRRRRKQVLNGQKDRMDENGINDNMKPEPLVKMAPKLLVLEEELGKETIKSEDSSKKKKVTVSVADCLACSGCVTSSEAVLLTRHSIPTLLENSKGKLGASSTTLSQKKVAFSISPACISDLTRYFNSTILTVGDNSKQKESPITTFLKLSTFLHDQLGADYVLDALLSNQVSLIESSYEFIHRYQLHQNSKEEEEEKQYYVPPNTVPLSSTKTNVITPSSSSNSSNETNVKTITHEPGRDKSTHLSRMHNPLPLLSSSCPGFVCYIEKTHGEIISNLSSVKSSMAISGTFFKQKENKENLATINERKETNNIYHVAIMPCHDKKLEANRKDLAWEHDALLSYSSPSEALSLEQDVDLVLTTDELLSIIHDVAQKEYQQQTSNSNIDLTLLTHKYFNSLKLPQQKDSSSISTLYSSTTAAGDESSYQIFHSAQSINTDVAHTTTDNNTNHSTAKLPSPHSLPPPVGSGSYADFVFRLTAHELFDYDIPLDFPLPWARPCNTSRTINNTSSNNNSRRRHLFKKQSTNNSNNNQNTDLLELILYRDSNTGGYTFSSSLQHIDSEMNPPNNKNTPVLRFATAYGFKNIQLLLQKISKQQQSKHMHLRDYDFVEVMACPSGCLNGGGQIKEEGNKHLNNDMMAKKNNTMTSIQKTREKVKSNLMYMQKQLSHAYWLHEQSQEMIRNTSSSPMKDTTDSPPSLLLLDKMFYHDNDNKHVNTILPFGKYARENFHTRFHFVPKLELTTGATKGVAVNDTMW